MVELGGEVELLAVETALFRLQVVRGLRNVVHDPNLRFAHAEHARSRVALQRHGLSVDGETSEVLLIGNDLII